MCACVHSLNRWTKADTVGLVVTRSVAEHSTASRRRRKEDDGLHLASAARERADMHHSALSRGPAITWHGIMYSDFSVRP
jgi:hypothetical protein